QSLYESWRIVQASAHLKLREAQSPGEMAGFVIDLAECLDVIGNKSNRDNADLAHLLACKLSQCVGQRRLQPTAGADFALVAEAGGIAPSAALHYQTYGFFNLSLVRVAFFDYRHRNTVGAEHDLGPLQLREAGKRLVYFFYDGVLIHRIPIECLDAMDGDFVTKPPVPFVQA